MTARKWRRGFPAGSAELVLPAAYYEDIYARHEHQRTGMWRHWTKQSGKHLWYATALLAEPPILDIGCGAGHLAALYGAFGMREAYAGGLDCSATAIRMARRHAPWASFARGHAQGHRELLARPHYRTAVFLEMLEHIIDDRELLQMVPVGRGVVFSVPSFETPGHCRWFATGQHVIDRYSPLLDIDRVVVEEGVLSDNRWFLVKGQRR